MTSQKKILEIYTDGSARGNPGPAGWGSVIIDHVKESVVELGGRFDLATNNRMELLALNDTLAYIEEKKMYETPIVIFIDSTYVLKGVTLWMYAWEKNSWKTASGSDVLNQDLWQEILYTAFRLKRLVTLKFEKIAGHAGELGNEMADRLATSFADKKPTLLFKGSLSDYQKLAELYLAELKPKKNGTSSSVSKNGKPYSYVSYVDGIVYTDKDWKSCEARVKGKKNVRYKKVFSASEEKEVINEFQGSK